MKIIPVLVFSLLPISFVTAGASECLDISRAANMGFADPVADDRKGGWTDQGPANDLDGLAPGLLEKHGLTFAILDPLKNNGHSAIVFSGPERDYFLRRARVPVDQTRAFPYLHLLHSTAWTPSRPAPAGVIRVIYRDGSESRHEVQTKKDVGNWWGLGRLENAFPFWEKPGVESRVGLFASAFPIEKKPVKEIVLEGSGRAVWMVAALSLSDTLPEFPEDETQTFAAGEEWGTLPAFSLDIEKDSIFDFSFLLDAPAGKYGPLKATKDGHFEFEGRPGKPVRFWGVNLTFGALFPPDKESADRMAERLARSGYNTVRFHCYDADIVTRTGASYEWNAEKLDAMDRLFAALKERGIYINIDLYVLRKISQEEVPDLGKDLWFNFKGLVHVSDAAFAAWKRFAETLLDHRNPYTGLTWGEDPALIGICPVNEDTLSLAIKHYDNGLADFYQDRFVKWLEERKGNDPSGRSAVYNKFLIETQRAGDIRLHDFLRSAKVKALLSGANWVNNQATTYLREHYDYVDMHGYWDHMTWVATPWRLPAKFTQESATQKQASLPRFLMGNRIFGKPYVITEFCYSWPNRYRAEGGVLMPAYASLQDWDALYHYEYAKKTTGTSFEADFFTLGGDPVRLLADRVGALMFLSRMVRPASDSFAFAVREETAFASDALEFPYFFSALGLVSRIGSVNGDNPENLSREFLGRFGVKAVVSDLPEPEGASGGLPYFRPTGALVRNLKEAGLLESDRVDLDQGTFVSDTGEISLDAQRGTASVIADRVECHVLPAGAHAAGPHCSVANGGTFAAAQLVAVDGKFLKESERMLFLFLTDATNTGTVLAGSHGERLEAYGQLPHLIRKGNARVTLTFGAGPKPEVWAVDPSGKRIRAIPVERTAAGFEWYAEAIGEDGLGLAYEITKWAN